LAVTAGNLVQPNSATALVTITQTMPIYATFSVPEQDLPRIRKSSNSKDFRVEVSVPGDESAHEIGTLSLVDNTADSSTGTIKLKATFLNASRRLFPGQFVNVTLTLGTQNNAIVVPSQAVQIGQDNAPFVYVVKQDMTVENRKVRTGATIDNMTGIEEGLQAGEQVVTDGQLRIVPGAKVQPSSDNGRMGGTGGGGNGRGGGNNSMGGGEAGPANGQQGGAGGGQGNPGQGNPGANGGSGGTGSAPGGTSGGTGSGASGSSSGGTGGEAGR
jgi:multidrug efflux system membrane fusion protein